MTGPQHHRKLERMYAAAPINDYFAPRLRVGHAEAELQIDVRADFHHAAGAMHGVVYFKALDDATFFAANSLVEDVFVLTAGFEIQFLKPVIDGTLCARARVTEEEGSRIVAVGDLFDSQDRLVGRGTGRFARSKIRLTPEVHYR